ncbi:MAG: FmdB family zinc ribbon protein [Chloroflexota bacterium]|nr:FmdB family zinc ribbon protein [Chloroflexota bacterium]
MARYVYHCSEYTSTFDARRPMAHADDLAPYPACGSLLTARVFTAPTLAGRASAPVESAPSGVNAKRNHRAGCPCC